MTSPIALPALASSERDRLNTVHALRNTTLERLYERRAAVDDLIRSLEGYMRSVEGRDPVCVEFNAVRKYS